MVLVSKSRQSPEALPHRLSGRSSKRKGKRQNGSQGQSQGKEALSLKERMAQKRKADRIRKELINFTLLASFLALMLGSFLAMVAGPKLAIGAAGGILVLALAFKYPRYALWGFLIYLPFGGTITYALGNSPLLQLSKDGLYLPALIGVIQYCRRERQPFLQPKQIAAPLVLLLCLCGLTLLIANGYQQFFGKPGEQPIAMGILGLKVLLGYLPLISCSYYLIRNKQDWLFLMRLMVILILICCGLAFIQYLLLLTGKCAGTRDAVGDDLFKASLSARCFVGGALLYSPQQGVIRLPGTFVAPWQWGWFLISSSFLAFAVAFGDPKFLWRIVGLAAMGAIFVMAVVSGQRIALALVPTVIVVLLLGTGQVTNLTRFIPIAVGLGLLLGIAAIQHPEVVQERLDSFISRWNASPPYAFILDQLRWAMRGNNILGHGLGRATNSARALGETELVETYYPKLIYEIGPIGTLAFLLLVTVLVYVTFKVYRSLRNHNLRVHGATLWFFVLFISYNTYYYPLDVDPVAVYYWFFAGVLLKLPEIEQLIKREPEEEVLPQKKQQKKKQRRLKRPGFA